MCGIVGLLSFGCIYADTADGVQARSLHSLGRGMLGLIEHRGPDEMGLLTWGAGFIGSARLSIVDLVTGSQPISNERKDVWVVYNGEIYDCDIIRHQLRTKGHRFITSSDTELLVHLYEEVGEDICLH